MTILGTEPVFPNNAVLLISDRAKTLDSGLANSVYRRPLRDSDPSESVGVHAALWSPDEESYEMMGGVTPRSNEPSIQRYTLMIQAFIKDFDEERGLAKHSVLSKMIRTMLYRDDPLRVGLSALQTAMSGSVERTQRWGIGVARYLSNEIDGNFLYLSTLEFWLETETV